MSPTWIRIDIRATVCALLCTLWASAGAAVTIMADFRASTYQVSAGETHSDLSAEHFSGALLAAVGLEVVENVSAQVEAGVSGDYSQRIAVVLDIAAAGQYEFQAGTDWGRGGSVAVIDNGTGIPIYEFVTDQDIWWGNDWNNSDVLSAVVNLAAGESYTIEWIGFEGCCAGVTTIRFAYEGAAFQTLSTANFAPFVVPVPEGATGMLLGLGLAAVSIARRRPISTTR